MTDTHVADSVTAPAATGGGTFDVDDFRTRYKALLDDLNLYLFERGNEIQGIGLAGLGRLNMFNLGTPGLAKSMLPREYCARIEGLGDEGFFDMQFNRTTVPEEMLGPMSLKALEEDRYARNPARRLPRALVALLDEFFKGSSAILNVGLKALEERMWDNDGHSEGIPLWFAICPSNECPTDAEFAAIRDRLPLSYKSEPLKGDDTFARMLQSAVKRHVTPTPQKFVSVEEIEQAQQLVRHVKVNDVIYDGLSELRRNLAGDGVVPTDRRFVKALQVMQAHAFLDGRDEVTSLDYRILRHVLWTNPETDIRIVERHVLDLANPLDREASDLLELIDSLSATYDRTVRDAATQEERVRQTLESFTNLREITERSKTMIKNAKERNYQSDLIDEVQKSVQNVSNKLKSSLGIDDGGLPGIGDGS